MLFVERLLFSWVDSGCCVGGICKIVSRQTDKRVDFRSILTRSALVSSINSMNLLALVPSEVGSAYELLTSEFNPLELCKKLDPLLASLEMRVDHRNGTLHFGSQQLFAYAA
uniref:Uncharacterized protein n=1 Tax=Tetradesmus obliquus TaxID=3088 RepID=A0A383WAC2_TETOB|eukprot:jgi/Sobl393_1/11078/SZX74585.1